MIFKPTVWIKSVLQIDAKLLKKYKIHALILDLDNTLSLHDNPNAEAGIFEWLDKMRSLKIQMVVVSNNNVKRVTPIAQAMELDFFANGCKPLPFGINRAIKHLGLPKNKIAIVGDQIFTDILGGNLQGLKTILVEPFHVEDKIMFRIKRKIENAVFKKDFSKLNKI